MTGILDIGLRVGLLAGVTVAAGGVAWVRLVLRAQPHARPDRAGARALRITAAAAGLAAVFQAALAAATLLAVGDGPAPALAGRFLDTGLARVALARVALALGLAVLARRLAGRPAGPTAWWALVGLAGLLVVSSAALGHAAARVDGRARLLALDAAHQTAVAVWVGGLAHLVIHALGASGDPHLRDHLVARRFSSLALLAVTALVASGVGLTAAYAGGWSGLVGTAYGTMILTKVLLLAAALGLAVVSRRLVRRARVGAGDRRLRPWLEAELGLAAAVLFAATSLGSTPPAADVAAQWAAPAEVAARFAPAWPRLASPAHDELLARTAPAPGSGRTDVMRAWSESNHHWSGLFVLLAAVLAGLQRAGFRAGRHWPLVFLALAAFVFVRADPDAWPLGPAGFWATMREPDALQHRVSVLLVVLFGVFEWLVQTGRLPARPWAGVFPLLCAAGGLVLLAHSHGLDDPRQEFLIEVTHAPLAVLGILIGWGRWLEVRLPGAGAGPGWCWRASLVVVGLLLLLYREG